MSEHVALINLRCPTCGAPLKAKNSTETITCVYCGNTIVPVTESTPVQKNEGAAGFGGVVKVEGIKTSSSALAYIELFFEEYDWEAFAYAQALSVVEIDKLVNSLKVSSADDKSTWFACFKALSVPYANKIASCKRILSSVIAEYKADNLDAYSKFDAYKRIAAMIAVRKDEVIANLEKIAAKAAKYGATSTEVSGLLSEIDTIKKSAVIAFYREIQEIPEINTFIQEKNGKIVAELAAAGIHAESEYARAKALINEKNYVAALNILLSLKGYSDTKALIEKLDKYYLLSDVLEVGGNLYYFKKDSAESQTLSLYPTKDGKISDKAIIKNIGKMIANHADVLYYLTGGNKLKLYNLSSNVDVKILDKTLSRKSVYVYGRRVFLLAHKGDEYTKKFDIVVLDLVTGAVNTILESVQSIVSLTDNKLVYTVAEKANGNDYNSTQKTWTCVMNVDTMKIVTLGTEKVNIEGFVNDCVVYTQAAPNDYNNDLYIKALNTEEPAKLIEQNIYDFCSIIADKLFYYIGNSRNKSLININCDGSERKEWPLYISSVLFEQGGWVYFIRRAGYNSILCKSRLNGSRFSIIAADIDKFIDIKNGYLYYINDSSALVKVRMDGSNLQELCDDVEDILAVKEDKIIFVSVDDRITVGEYPQVTKKTVKSIYAVDFAGGGKIKLAYNIKNARKYDENTVYYIAAKETKSSFNQVDVLHKVDAETYSNEALLEIKLQVEQKSGCYVATCVYGSYDCPQVWTLRRFRDNCLAETWYGRGFIHTYYAVSPSLVKWFGHTSWFKKLWKGLLDKMVSKLQANGFASTPYADKNW